MAFFYSKLRTSLYTILFGNDAFSEGSNISVEINATSDTSIPWLGFSVIDRSQKVNWHRNLWQYYYGTEITDNTPFVLDNEESTLWASSENGKMSLFMYYFTSDLNETVTLTDVNITVTVQP